MRATESMWVRWDGQQWEPEKKNWFIIKPRLRRLVEFIPSSFMFYCLTGHYPVWMFVWSPGKFPFIIKFQLYLKHYHNTGSVATIPQPYTLFQF